MLDPHTLERRDRPTSPAMVGRDSELELLLTMTTLSPALVLIEGESGVGKTRLVQELLARPELAERRTFVGRCFELSEPYPLGPMLEALRAAQFPHSLPAVCGALRPLLPELEDRLPEALPALGDTGAERHRLFRGLLALLVASGPSLLVVEDLHSVDQVTMEFLRFLVIHPPPELMIVCTYRREDLPEGSPLLTLDARLPMEVTAVRIVLAPLGEEQVRDLVRTVLDITDVPEAFAAYLRQRTAGLPLAVEEVLLVLRQRHDLVGKPGALVRQQLDELAVPQGLHDDISQRLGRISPSARSVVHAAAVLTLVMDEGLLAQITGLDEFECGEALAEALASSLLVELDDGHYGCRHPLARQAVEEGIPTPLRRQLHLRAARALERSADRPLARLAHHYRAAGDTEKWIRYAEAAADRATSLNDHAAAYALLRGAVSVSTISPVMRGSLAIKLARHATRCRAYEDAIVTLRALLQEDVIATRLRGRLRFWLGRLLHDSGEPQAAQDEAVQALEELEGPFAAQVMAWLATVPWGLNSIPERLLWVDRALAIVARSSDRAVHIEIAASRATLLVSIGDPQCWKAIREFPQPGATLSEIEQGIRGYGNIADALLHSGHYLGADELNGQAMRMASEHSPSFASHFDLTALQLDWLTGRWQGLEDRLQSQMTSLDDWPTGLHLCEALLGLLLLARGRTQRALALLEPLAGKLDGDSRVLTWIAAGVARARLAERRPDAALESTDQALRIVERDGMWLWAGDLVPIAVEALLEVGRRSDALRVITCLSEAVHGRHAPAAAAALVMSWALLAEADRQPGRAATLFQEADRAWQALPRPYEAAKARARAGHCLLSIETERGQGLLLDALTTFRDLGGEWEAELVRHLLRRHGLTPTHRRGRRPYGKDLSPRETEVARLAAEGLRNREIARTLHLSVKTVEGHLSSARRKLGVSPRTGSGPDPRPHES